MVVGVIKYFKQEAHAKIKVLAYKENGVWIKDREIIDAEFHKDGHIFEPHFSTNFPGYTQGDCIKFSHQENENRLHEYHDIYRINNLNCKLDYKVVNDNRFPTSDDFVEIDYLQKRFDELPGKFYIEKENGFYGPFKKENGKIKPKVGKAIGFRSGGDIEWVSVNENKKIVIDSSDKPEKELEASTHEQLKIWFKQLLNQTQNTFLNPLLENPDWKKEIDSLEYENIAIKKVRIQRVIDSLENYGLTLQALKQLGGSSETLQAVYKQMVEGFKEEIIQQTNAEMNAEVEQMNYALLFKKSEKEGLEEAVEELKDELNYLERNKERLLADFKVFQHAANISNIENAEKHSLSTETPKKKYTIQSSNENTTEIELDHAAFEAAIQHNLMQYGKEVKEEYFRSCLKIIASCKCVLSDAPEFLLAFVKATNNYCYTISYVEVNWLSFQHLWENGLGEIWNKAYENPERLHFLILRDINMSSPECYAKPLLDLGSGILESLPFDDKKRANSWPENLRIFATVQIDLDIGLPIKESTFRHWGGLPEDKFVDADPEDFDPEDTGGMNSFANAEMYQFYKEQNVDLDQYNSIEAYFRS